jgi:hypothetical protein
MVTMTSSCKYPLEYITIRSSSPVSESKYHLLVTPPDKCDCWMRSLGRAKRNIEASATRTGFLKTANWHPLGKTGGVHRGVDSGRELIAYNYTLLMRLGTLPPTFNQNQSRLSWGRGF